jgi:GNAT superfamily N-acetyltransferase
MDSRLTDSLLTAYCVALANRNRVALGFIPKARFAERVTLGQVLPEFENGDLCGYLLVGRARDYLHIHQACIQDDARKMAHGRALVERVAQRARRTGCQGISLRCAADLPSNAFWQALGFAHVTTLPGGLSRGRIINVYQISFPDAFPLIERPEAAGLSLPLESRAASMPLPAPASCRVLLPPCTEAAASMRPPG